MNIEPDYKVSLSQVEADESFFENVVASWRLERLDQRNLPLDGNYVYSSTGDGITTFVVDTGIRYTHTDFGGRAIFGYDSLGGNGSDCHGHGTHVAANFERYSL